MEQNERSTRSSSRLKSINPLTQNMDKSRGVSTPRSAQKNKATTPKGTATNTHSQTKSKLIDIKDNQDLIITEVRQLHEQVRFLSTQHTDLLTLCSTKFGAMENAIGKLMSAQSNLNNNNEIKSVVSRIVRQNKRLIDKRNHHFYHYTADENKSALFTTFLTHDAGVFIPRKFREKVAPSDTPEIKSIKRKGAQQKMQINIDSMIVWAKNHCAKVRECDEDIEKIIIECSSNSDIVNGVRNDIKIN